MLAKLTDKDGDEVWVNPIHVRSVVIATGLLGGHKGTQVMLSGDTFHGHKVFVRESPATAAARLNAAMPTVMLASELAAITEEPRQQPQNDDASHTAH